MRKREFNNRMSLRGAYLYATWQSRQNKIVGRDPHVSPMDFLRMTSRMISRDPHVSPMDFLRMTRRMISRDPHVGFSILLRMTNFKIGRSLDDCLRNRGMTAALWILVSSVTMTGTVRAECVPSPDCAEMGYTETSCDGDSLKCPFDLSKLYCIPCDSSFQYACNGEGQVGQGESCDGKYLECGCSDGYELENGACEVSCSYTVTSLPSKCSVADFCVKGDTTYYSSSCTTCNDGYTLSSGSCKAATCSGYYSSKTGCSSYTTCLSGTTTKYKCTACSSGYSISSGQCKKNSCDGYTSKVFKCSSNKTCQSGSKTYYECTKCASGYVLYEVYSGGRYRYDCIEENCYNSLIRSVSPSVWYMFRYDGVSCLDYDGQEERCVGSDGETYIGVSSASPDFCS